MSELVGPIVDWLGDTGAPNLLVVVFLLTRPVYWARAVRERTTSVLDSWVGGD